MWGGSCVNGKKNEMEILNQNNLDLLRSESIKHEQHNTELLLSVAYITMHITAYSLENDYFTKISDFNMDFSYKKK